MSRGSIAIVRVEAAARERIRQVSLCVLCTRLLCYHALRDEIINSVAFPQLKNARKLFYFLCFASSAFNYPPVPRSLLSILPYYDAKSKQEKRSELEFFFY